MDDAILEALQRRQMGGANLAGQAVGVPPQPQAPSASSSALPAQVSQGSGSPAAGALQAGQKAQGPSFDPETRELAKSLVARLLKGL